MFSTLCRKMNLVAYFGLILICCHAWTIEIDDNSGWTYERKTKLENFLENFKSSLQNGTSGLEIYGISVFDPLIVNKLPIKFNTSTFVGNTNIEGFLENLNVSGLASYKVNSASFALINWKMHVDLTWPLLITSTNYSLKGNALDREIYGDGNVDGAAHNCRAIVDINFALRDQHIQVKTVATKIFLEALNFNATGVYDNKDISEIYSKIVSEVVPKLFADEVFQTKIADIINKIFPKVLNKTLPNISIYDLLKKIGV